ncbi:MAG: hypothetical protein H6806_02535 [Planctomycetes bacterium]|nr:hypothetical protein [Planctomycetota bacterium]MCB9828630.1 hypothetical protein [Planctomycetota bacterium]MCB9900991.1 hypothetical protein [Planctomycetota bacterium]
MLARSRSLAIPGGVELELPLLVPSYTSKGFPFSAPAAGKRGSSKELSDVANVMRDMAPHSPKATLISAYDIHFGHLHERAGVAPVMGLLRDTALVFIDSGGYELAPDFDSTEPRIMQVAIKSGYDLSSYTQVLAELGKLRDCPPLCIASYDWETRGLAFREQVQRARDFFDEHQNHMSDVILKPWKAESSSSRRRRGSHSPRLIDLSTLSRADFKQLSAFAIIGVTEKELGASIWDRLKAVAVLRSGLDDAGVDSPIHVYGGLDPVLTPLYFFAGAEIFDGASWLRYAYWRGVATCQESYGVLHPQVGVQKSTATRNGLAFSHNLSYLDNLACALREWVLYEGQQFNMFDTSVEKQLEQAYRTMRAGIASLKGGA